MPAPCHSRPPGGPATASRGYVLFDVLIAQLLLATTLLGGGLALVQAIAAGRAAALQTTAVDLLADLGEALHTMPLPARTLADWPARVASLLPAGEGQLALPESTAGTEPVVPGVRWQEPGQPRPLRLELSLVPPPAPAPP